MHPPERCFAVGDVQGCLTPLQRLLEDLCFDPAHDHLILVGDLVNRGPDSLGVLRFARGLGDAATCLLGNHDLHLLAAARNGRLNRKDTLDDLLAADDRDLLLHWLRHRPLCHWHAPSDTLLVHAGLAPQWTAQQARALAAEVEAVLRGPDHGRLLDQLYGDDPDHWHPALADIERWRFVINTLTRMRMLHADGRLNLRHKGPPDAADPSSIPWFLWPQRAWAGTRIVFGHWSTLGRLAWPQAQVYGLDSGCVWGGALTAMELNTGVITQQPCPPAQTPG
ncbi:symmetrical bis(5'-nucleosyl)-tetraphosphatase [Flagellatimonas centrodinii]|uniref:symmetrical bis(5'-nucleosyl)-tetraphosphatase n=1 Tax=Flagellatimonas centrodinii TaxID=2806210 RepID=UPI001FEDF12C|nr:symmetrical bis(5'-nucleosyl)-tetraphosphatase [Flagellatimonas centrodinii]ULQ45345.1 symmetrical bis(5'-nucleosyl)-tetraphosphatase [Flagellatimonas centrodinii]